MTNIKGLFGNIFENNSQKTIFENSFQKQFYDVFWNKNIFGNLECSQRVFCVSKYFLKVAFIRSSLFSIILHIFKISLRKQPKTIKDIFKKHFAFIISSQKIVFCQKKNYETCFPVWKTVPQPVLILSFLFLQQTELICKKEKAA